MTAGPTRAALLAAALWIAVAPACGYRLLGRDGVLTQHGLRTLGVPVFGNRTERPEIEQRFTEQVISELITRTRLQVSGSDRGVDAVLEGEILAYHTQPVTVNPDGRASRYEATVRARVALLDLRDDRLLWEDEQFVFKAQYDVEADLQEFVDLEIVAIDRVARGFAASVVNTLMEGF